jgi:hypothetical protein
MIKQALSTLPREAKGPLAPPPALDGPLRVITDMIAAWPEVGATTHWHLHDCDRVDRVPPRGVGTVYLGSVGCAVRRPVMAG